MTSPKTKFTISVPDQFEIEPVESYYKSYTDRVYLPIEDGETAITSLGRNRKTVKLHSVRDPFFDFNNMPLGYQSKLRNLGPLFGPGFLLQRFQANTIDYLLGGTITASYNINTLNSNIVESASLIPKENITSPSQNLVVKLFCNEEQYADTVLPRPADIVETNGGKFVEGYSEYYHPGSLLMPNTEFSLETSDFGVKRTPKKFKLLLGSYDSSTVVTNSQGGATISDNKWCSSFPFEYKYRSLQKFSRPNFDKKFTVTITQSILANVQFSGGLDLVATSQVNSFESTDYSIQWCFSTIGPHRETSGNKSPWHNKRRYITLLDVPIVVSGVSVNDSITKVVVRPTGNLEYPEANEVYKGFYGVYHKNNEMTPYYESIELPSGSYEYAGGGWRFGNKINGNYNPFSPNYIGTVSDQTFGLLLEKNKLRGWRSHEGFIDSSSIDTSPVDNRLNNSGKFPISHHMAGYTSYGSLQKRSDLNNALVATCFNYFPVEDFNIHYLRLTGWKYGVYHALPCYSSCHFRRGKFGMFRDMLEQRPYTKFVKISINNNNKRRNNTKVENLGAACLFTFLSSSTAFVTSSNPSLNTRDSGIYDIEGKAGQPFADRDS